MGRALIPQVGEVDTAAAYGVAVVHAVAEAVAALTVVAAERTAAAPALAVAAHTVAGAAATAVVALTNKGAGGQSFLGIGSSMAAWPFSSKTIHILISKYFQETITPA